MFSFLFLAFIALVKCQDDPDVVVLTTDNFDEVLKNEFVLVEFYAPWCGHCKKLAPEYAAAATALKNSGSNVVIAKVDATIESSLGERFAVRGYPTLKFFRNGEPVDYDGGRTAKDLINWVNKKSGPPSKTLDSAEAVKSFIAVPGTKGVAYLADPATWVAFAKDDRVATFAFAHVSDSGLFGDNKEGTVILHKDGEEPQVYTGALEVDALSQWFLAEGFPLVDELAQESWTRAQISRTDLLAIFVAAGDSATASAALEIAKATKGSLVVTSSDQVGIASRWGSSGNVVPTAIYVSNKVEGSPSFTIWNEDSNVVLNAESLKDFVEQAKAGTYDSWIKSEPVPEPNDGPVTILVGKNFESIVKEKKDVLVEFYAPWCGHCKKLEPIYNELGEFFKDDDNVVIAKIDATANGTPKGVSVSGYPTLIFWDANNKQVDYHGDRELDAFKAWIKENRASKPSSEKAEL